MIQLTVGLMASGVGVPVDVLALERCQACSEDEFKALTPGAACKSITV